MAALYASMGAAEERAQEYGQTEEHGRTQVIFSEQNSYLVTPVLLCLALDILSESPCSALTTASPTKDSAASARAACQ